MTRVVVIVDTNVVVAGLLTTDSASPVARVLDGMLRADFPFVVSEALLSEYRSVLLRPKLQKLHRLRPAEVDAILIELAQRAIVSIPKTAAPAPDPGDQLLWDLLATRPDLQLVTGDGRLLRDAGMRGRVISPAAFIALD